MATLTTPGQRAAAYWFVDGFPEIVYGATYLLWGILGLYWRESGRWQMRWAVLAAGVLFVTLFITDRRVIGFLKARFTYPRTGYVRPPAEPAQRRTVDDNITQFRVRTVIAVFLASRFVAIVQVPWWAAVVMCALACFLYWSARQDVRPYSMAAVLPLAALGVAAGFLKIEPAALEFIPIALGGAWFLAIGSVSLVRYWSGSPA